MLERLHFILGGCVSKDTQGDRYYYYYYYYYYYCDTLTASTSSSVFGITRQVL